jgi:hypothetical protein
MITPALENTTFQWGGRPHLSAPLVAALQALLQGIVAGQIRHLMSTGRPHRWLLEVAPPLMRRRAYCDQY